MEGQKTIEESRAGEVDYGKIRFYEGPTAKLERIRKILGNVDPENIFYIDTDPERSDTLRIHVGGTILPLNRYNNVAFIAREAALRIMEVMGESTPQHMAFIISGGVFEGISGIIVKMNREDVSVSGQIMQALKGFDIRVIERILTIAEEIRNEGREGKKIGTLFVVGSPEELQPYLKQLILNPFRGYPPEERNILRDDIAETVKEFAQLDGAFIVSKDGTIVSAGTYIDIDTSSVRRYSGWGTRHLAAAAITAKTNSVAILVSESGGKIKVFRRGRIVLRR